MRPESQLSTEIARHWQGLIADTSGDKLTEGGQSIAELERLEAFEAFLSTLPREEIPTFHHFANGVYSREIHAPADSILIGHEHRHECLNYMLKGRVLTICNGVVTEFVAPCVAISGAHTRKASIVVEDMVWITVHPNPDNETDIAKLQERLTIPSRTFLALHDKPREI